ncbi:MAG: GNAT family N-acetyltransferase, partial [Dehalococcoidia bacterium]|nr:GNAT family N-acetyltransferase [Dehalococcoidia bacterium]
SDEIFRALFDALLEIDWTEAELRGLRDGSPTLAALANAPSLACEQEHEAVSPRVQPPADWDEYLASLRKKHRHELRRKLRRLGAAGEIALQHYTRPDDVSERLPTLLRFMVESRSDKAAFMSEHMGRFFHRMAPAMAEEGLVRLYELELDAKTVASVLCFDQGGQLFFYNSGYDPDYASLAVGLVSKALCLRNAIELGRHCVDFLRGDEAYKYDLGGRDQHVYRCLVRRR